VYDRFVKARIIEAMSDTPVVLLVGPRRAGKTTLVRKFSDETHGYWSDIRVTPFHFRDWEKNEVNMVLERDDGAILGIEVKAGATVSLSDFTGLRKLADACGDRFAFGVMLYDGDAIIPAGSKLAAAPLSCLWSS